MNRSATIQNEYVMKQVSHTFRSPARSPERGFSLIELMVVAVIAILLLAIAIPSVVGVTRNYRITADTRGVAAQLQLARLRAASGGTKTRVNFNTAANTYQIELWSTGAGAYQLEGGVTTLSQGNTFGFGSISTPAGQQSTIAETTPIYFNSRGFATDSSGNPIATSAIYITNSQGTTSAVAVSIAGLPSEYRYNGSAWALF
jgi:Tfp pilus assembly protein FimT